MRAGRGRARAAPRARAPASRWTERRGACARRDGCRAPGRRRAARRARPAAGMSNEKWIRIVALVPLPANPCQRGSAASRCPRAGHPKRRTAATGHSSGMTLPLDSRRGSPTRKDVDHSILMLPCIGRGHRGARLDSCRPAAAAIVLLRVDRRRSSSRAVVTTDAATRPRPGARDFRLRVDGSRADRARLELDERSRPGRAALGADPTTRGRARPCPAGSRRPLLLDEAIEASGAMRVPALAPARLTGSRRSDGDHGVHRFAPRPAERLELIART
jgi:hypothetical protein